LIRSTPPGTPGAVSLGQGAQAYSAFWGFQEIVKPTEINPIDQTPKDTSWKLTFESPTLNYAAKMLQFEGWLSWATSWGGLEPSSYESFILPNGDMCMNMVNRMFPAAQSSTKSKFIFTLGTSLWYNIIGWEVSERCDLGCTKCQPKEKHGGEWNFIDIWIGQLPILLEHSENGNIQV
jgi:hypothetical protein